MLQIGSVIRKYSKDNTMCVNMARQVLREVNVPAGFLIKASTMYCALIYYISPDMDLLAKDKPLAIYMRCFPR